jgi:hypothetical protein
MKIFLATLYLSFFTLFTQCNTLKKIPTNTSGSLFSLNGNWKLTNSNDNNALQGTVVRVVPGFANATIKTVNNNNYCLREMDVIWKDIKNTEGGTFNVENMVDACNSASVYRPGMITVVNNDEIRLASRTAAGAELIQTWKRVDTQ